MNPSEQLKKHADELAAIAEARTNKLSHVLSDFRVYDLPGCRLLADEAVMMIWATLAGSRDYDETESLFYDLVDMSYSESSHATSSLTDQERSQMYDAAHFRRGAACELANAHMVEDGTALKNLPEEDARRRMFNYSYFVSREYFPHSESVVLIDFISTALCLCAVMQCQSTGFHVSEGDVADWMMKVAMTLKSVSDNVTKRIKAGQLAIIGGEIVDPSQAAE